MKAELLRFENVSFSYDQVPIFENLSFVIPLCHTVIMDNSNSGKTTLLKLASGKLKPTQGRISILGLEENFLCSFLDDITFTKETVYEELNSVFETQGVSKEIAEERIYEIATYFALQDKLDSKIRMLSVSEKYLVKLLSLLLLQPKVIAFDDTLRYFTFSQKDILFRYLKEQRIASIHVTSNIEDTRYADYMMIFHQGKVAVEGEVQAVLREEKLLHRLGYQLPFLVDLCTQLMYYQLIDSPFLDAESLVNALWK